MSMAEGVLQLSKNDLMQCDRQGCDEWFVKKTHNQRYHNDECCRLATNARLMAKYYARRDQRQGKTRICEECMVTKLSRYNDSLVCSSCTSRRATRATNEVLDMISNSAIIDS